MTLDEHVVLNIFSSSISFDAERATSIIVLTPLFTNSMAVCFPIPEDAPVINTFFPSNCFLFKQSLYIITTQIILSLLNLVFY
jgi:hypothetical protein